LRHLGGAAGAFGEWLFSFITVFAGGIALGTVGWKIWIWMLLSCAVAIPFVYFMCPEVRISLGYVVKLSLTKFADHWKDFGGDRSALRKAGGQGVNVGATDFAPSWWA
jgi:hypothetical protein